MPLILPVNQLICEYLLDRISLDHKYQEFLALLHPNQSVKHARLRPVKVILGVVAR
jgi:hypothetical protein